MVHVYINIYIADRTKQNTIIIFSVDWGKTPVETKQMMAETGKHRNSSNLLIY